MQSDSGESNMHPPKARVFFPAAACTGDNSGIWRTSCGAACTRGRLFRATRRYLRIRTSPIPARRKADASERGRIESCRATHRQVAVVHSLVLRRGRLRPIVFFSVAVLAGLIISLRSALLALSL